MGLFKLNSRKKENNQAEAMPSQVLTKDMKKFLVKFAGFVGTHGMDRSELVEPEYDLEEIKKASDADSYVKVALSKYSYLIYKAGYSVKSLNDEAADYIRLRFRLMSVATRKPMDILFQEVADDIVKFSNAFLIKARGDMVMPGVKANPVFGKKPVLGYFRVDPASIRIERDSHGTILSYVQMSENGEEKKFAVDDVVHFYLDRAANNAYGTPRYAAALEDVKLLRRVEGNVLALVYRFAMPLFHMKIGLPTPGQEASQAEIDRAQREMERSALDGMLFTNERTDIKAIGAEGNALNTDPILAYFEKRVFSALGVSESQMGRGGSKQDADSMEAQVHDTVKHIQRTLSIFIDNSILLELLLEGGFNPILNEEDNVSYIFNEISLETKVKLENHEILKFQSNVLQFEEVRTSLGLTNEVDENKLYAHMIDKTVVMEQQQQNLDAQAELTDKQLKHQEKISNQSAKLAAKANGNGKTPSAKSTEKQVDNNNRPENQHGKSSVKIKESFVDTDMTVKQKQKNHKKNYVEIYNIYTNLRNDISENDSDIDFVFPLSKEEMDVKIQLLLKKAALEGIERLLKESQKTFEPDQTVNLVLDMITAEASGDLSKLISDIKMQVEEIKSQEIAEKNKKVLVINVFDVLEYRLKFLLEYFPRKAYWFGYIHAAKALGYKKVYTKFSSEKDEENHTKVHDTNAIDLDQIPAYHAFCQCELTITK